MSGFGGRPRYIKSSIVTGIFEASTTHCIYTRQYKSRRKPLEVLYKPMATTVSSSGPVLPKTRPKTRNIKNLRLHVPARTPITITPPPPPPTPISVLRPHWHPGPKSSDKLILARSNAQRGEWTKVVLYRDQETGKSSHARKGFLGLLFKIKIRVEERKGKEKYIPPLSHRLREKRTKFKQGPRVQGSLRDIRRRRRVLKTMMITNANANGMI
ncbi:hypothetical protein PM082_012502 [Marasmius tenuissimus]|nr:hypothetical protein PM082_012502 [Marasmius tenuissimus]